MPSVRRGMPRTPIRRRGALATLLAAALAFGVCAAPDARVPEVPAAPAGPEVSAVALPRTARDADFLLLGEVHDNVAQHRLRLGWLEALADERRFALALEQLDADRQGTLEDARTLDEREARLPAAPDPATRARRVAQAGGFDFAGWQWDLYRPVIEFALRRGLPLVAANLSPADTMRIAQGRASPTMPPSGWGDAEAEAMRVSIHEGHCRLLPERAVEAMALAQRTRDARIARALVDAHERTGLPVVLLAGNGHVRRDIGVPAHLAALRPGTTIVSIGLLETPGREDGAGEAASGAGASDAGDDGQVSIAAQAAAFDIAVRTAAQPREDPCAPLRARFRRDQDTRKPSTSRMSNRPRSRDARKRHARSAPCA